MKTIGIPEFGIAYSESDKPVYVLIMLTENDQMDICLCLAENEERAKQLGAEMGRVLICRSLMSLLSIARLLLGVDKTLTGH